MATIHSISNTRKPTAAPKLISPESVEYQHMRSIALAAVQIFTPSDAVLFRDALISKVKMDQLYAESPPPSPECIAFMARLDSLPPDALAKLSKRLNASTRAQKGGAA